MTRHRRVRSIAPALLSASLIAGLSPAVFASIERGAQSGGSATATLTVHAHVSRNCLITATPVEFGDYDPLVANKSQPLDTLGFVSLTCTQATDVKVELDNGQNGAGGQRSMSSSGSLLGYELYQDGGRSRRWGAGTESYDVGAAQFGSGASLNAVNVYGRVPAGQNVPPGDYNDTITATVIF